MFTQGLSSEVGNRGITVNNVQPGLIDTDLNPAAGDWAAPRRPSADVDPESESKGAKKSRNEYFMIRGLDTNTNKKGHQGGLKQAS
jgi:NAD(P)-dependent dehydrogenase (short-subunit alcohol dehydrogenase family)